MKNIFLNFYKRDSGGKMNYSRFIKNLYLCHNEPVKMDTGNLFHGVITNAMRRRVASAGFRK